MICLSFDTDHMSEARMAEFLDQVAFPGEATFFCTQRYDCLTATPHEVAPHPYLADNDHEAELDRMRQMFPEATGWRAHSCVFSHILAEWLNRNGYRYVSTHDQFGDAGLRPVRHPWGVWHLPIYYMDNMDFSQPRFWPDEPHTPFDDALLDRAVAGDGLYVFDFHPIHLLLNTPDADTYFGVRDAFKAGTPCDRLRHSGRGARSYFDGLCERLRQAGQASVHMSDALDAFDANGRVVGA